MSSDPDALHRRAFSWLKNGNMDSVEWIINRFLAINAKYKIHFDCPPANVLASWCFEDPDHKVKHWLTNESPEYYSVNYHNVNTFLLNVRGERTKTFYSLSSWEVYFYFSVVFASLLISFRFTRLKPWLISLLGTGIWAIILGIIAAFSRGEAFIYIMPLLLIAFLCMSFMLIRNKKSKQVAAVTLNWFTHAFLLLIPSVTGIIFEHTSEISECVNGKLVIYRPEHPIHLWISSNWEIIHTINLSAGVLVILFVVIPLCYRWQANPSE
jgi:hypothetical protein